MNKKALLISLTVFGFVTCGAGAVSVFGDGANVLRGRSVDNTYTLTLDSSNQLLATDDGDAFYSLTTSGNRVYFAFDDDIERNPENGWVSLVAGGTFDNPYIFNTNKIKGIKSIRINSDYNNLKLHYGCEVDGEIIYSNYLEYDTTSIYETFTNYEPSYIKIEGYVGSGPNLLQSVIIEYSCSETEYVPTENLDYELIEGKQEYRITGFVNYKENIPDDLVIPSSIGGKPVAEIGDDAFNPDHYLTSFRFKSITIPNSVKYIGARAFENCQAVTKINMPTSGIEIGDDAFFNCGDMETVNISATQTEIDLAKYQASPVLKTINVAEGNPNFYSINGMLFAYSYSDSNVSNRNTLLYCPCGKTGTITVPNKDNSNNDITYIAKDAFKRSKASSISIGSNISAISEDFKSCSSLSSFVVAQGNSYYSVQNNMLCEGNVVVAYPIGNSNGSVTVPSTISKINDHVFDGVSSLEDVTIMGQTEIGVEAFANMPNLESISLSNVNEINSGAFKNDTSLNGNFITVSSTLQALPAETFMGCTSISSISLPSTLKTIGDRAFKNCSSLSSFPVSASLSTLETIGEEAFMNCTSLAISLIIPNTVNSVFNI